LDKKSQQKEGGSGPPHRLVLVADLIWAAGVNGLKGHQTAIQCEGLKGLITFSTKAG
jgi:hypothetical protein